MRSFLHEYTILENLYMSLCTLMFCIDSKLVACSCVTISELKVPRRSELCRGWRLLFFTREQALHEPGKDPRSLVPAVGVVHDIPRTFQQKPYGPDAR